MTDRRKKNPKKNMDRLQTRKHHAMDNNTSQVPRRTSSTPNSTHRAYSRARERKRQLKRQKKTHLGTQTAAKLSARSQQCQAEFERLEHQEEASAIYCNYKLMRAYSESGIVTVEPRFGTTQGLKRGPQNDSRSSTGAPDFLTRKDFNCRLESVQRKRQLDGIASVVARCLPVAAIVSRREDRKTNPWEYKL